jgi:hypothetical protein
MLAPCIPCNVAPLPPVSRNRVLNCAPPATAGVLKINLSLDMGGNVHAGQPGHNARSTLRGAHVTARANAPSFMSLPSLEGYFEVEAVKGIRLTIDGDRPQTEYLVKWKVRCGM